VTHGGYSEGVVVDQDIVLHGSDEIDLADLVEVSHRPRAAPGGHPHADAARAA
jgi:hypothetical protein